MPRRAWSSRNMLGLLKIVIALAVASSFTHLLCAQDAPSPFYDYRGESPGTIHKITVADLPAPSPEKSGVASPEPQRRPADAIPRTLPGFKVNLFATGFDEPREMRTAPNGDIFLADTRAGEIRVFRGITEGGKA